MASAPLAGRTSRRRPSQLLLLFLLPFLGTSIRLQGEELVAGRQEEQPEALSSGGSSGTDLQPDGQAKPTSSGKLWMRVANTEAATGADPVQIELDKKCNSAVHQSLGRVSHWRRFSHKCKCMNNFKMVCPGQDCNDHGRYFNPDDMEGKRCRCDYCAEHCGDIVERAEFRKSAWRRWSKKCKCPKGEVVSGEDAACHKERYFAGKDMRNKQCVCKSGNITSTEPPSATTTRETPLESLVPERPGAASRGVGGIGAVFVIVLMASLTRR